LEAASVVVVVVVVAAPVPAVAADVDHSDLGVCTLCFSAPPP